MGKLRHFRLIGFLVSATGATPSTPALLTASEAGPRQRWRSGTTWLPPCSPLCPREASRAPAFLPAALLGTPPTTSCHLPGLSPRRLNGGPPGPEGRGSHEDGGGPDPFPFGAVVSKPLEP